MHFVKHSLILAMLAVLTGCGGGSSDSAPPANNTPETPDNVTTVTSVSPQTAIIGVLTTFTLSGQNLSNGLQVTLPSCPNIKGNVESPNTVKFTCIPQAEGTQTLTVKTAAGASLFSSEIKFQATASAGDIVVSSIDIPNVVTVGQIATFIIKGQNLPTTLQISLPQCANIDQPGQSATQIRVTCTPLVAGTQTLKVSSETGIELRRGNVIMQSPPPALTGSWRQAAANGCTGTIEGETIVGARSKQPLFTFVKNKDTDTQVRLMGNEGIGYLSTDCSETSPTTTTPTTSESAPQFAVTTGVAKFAAIYDTLGTAQQTSGFNYYYPVKTSYSSTGFAKPNATAIVFKDTDNFCLFDGIVTPANIGTFVEGITINTAGCFVRSNRSDKVPFSQDLPASLLTTYQYQLKERQANDSSLIIVERLNQGGQKGEFLLREAKSLQPTIDSSTRNSYDLFGSFGDYKFDYRTEDEPVQDANFDTNRLAKLNELGKESYLLVGKRQLNNFLEPKPLYTKVSVGIRPKITFDYQLRSDSDVNATKLISILDAQGLQGCRFVDLRLQAAPATYATVCVNSSRNGGIFKYRYVPYPISTRTDALAALLDTQKSGGFYPIRVLKLGSNATPHILFEYNSTVEASIGGMEYKVYSQALPSNQPELNSLLNDQGKLGWHLWSQINDPSGKHLATIFANLPFQHLEEGEPVVLDPR